MSTKPNVPALITATMDTVDNENPVKINTAGRPLYVQCRIGRSRYDVPNEWKKDYGNWYLVVSLKDLSVVVNEVNEDKHKTPENLKKYIGNTEYMLLLSIFRRNLSNLPQGDLHRDLVKIGAGPKLRELENIVAMSGTGLYRQFTYLLAATMSTEDQHGFEQMTLRHSQHLAFEFLYHEVDGQPHYFPIQPR